MGEEELRREVEALISFADDRRRDDDAAWERESELIHRDPEGLFAAAESFAADPNPDRREIALDLLGGCAEYRPEELRDRALPILRRALRTDREVGPLAAAIVKLDHLGDTTVFEEVLGLAAHPDDVIRHAVAVTLPTLGADDARTIEALITLSADDDDDVRDWATFGLGEMLDVDTPEVREALLARLEDPHDDTRSEAIAGLARRRDERVRPYLTRELAKDDHFDIVEDARYVLDTGKGHGLVSGLDGSWGLE